MAARLRDDEYDLESSLADCVFDADPEWSAAGEIEDVGPDLVAVAGQSRPQPTDKLVVVRRRVADEEDVTFGHDLKFPLSYRVDARRSDPRQNSRRSGPPAAGFVKIGKTCRIG